MANSKHYLFFQFMKNILKPINKCKFIYINLMNFEVISFKVLKIQVKLQHTINVLPNNIKEQINYKKLAMLAFIFHSTLLLKELDAT